jgi:hypothetical protein
MPYNKYPAAYNTSTKVTRFVPRATLAMGGVGAIIGGTAAAAKNVRKVKEEEMTREEAVRDTIKEAAGTGLATAAATAVVTAVGATGWLSLVGIVAAATGAKYIWDSATSSARVEASAKEPVPEKTSTSGSKSKK